MRLISLPPLVLTVALLVGPRMALPAGLPAKPGERQPAVLFLVTRHAPLYRLYLKKYMREVTREGVQCDYCAWPELSWERIKAFNAIVLVHATMEGYTGGVPELFKKAEALFERFLKAGGGMLVTPVGITRLHLFQRLLEPHGALPYHERVTDHSKLLRRATPFRIMFAPTDAIEPHPTTEGVEHVWYGTGAQKQWETLTFPVACDSTWQVLVRGRPTSRSTPVTRTRCQYHGEAVLSTGQPDHLPGMWLSLLREEYNEGLCVLHVRAKTQAHQGWPDV